MHNEWEEAGAHTAPLMSGMHSLYVASIHFWAVKETLDSISKPFLYLNSNTIIRTFNSLYFTDIWGRKKALSVRFFKFSLNRN